MKRLFIGAVLLAGLVSGAQAEGKFREYAFNGYEKLSEAVELVNTIELDPTLQDDNTCLRTANSASVVVTSGEGLLEQPFDYDAISMMESANTMNGYLLQYCLKVMPSDTTKEQFKKLLKDSRANLKQAKITGMAETHPRG